MNGEAGPSLLRKEGTTEEAMTSRIVSKIALAAVLAGSVPAVAAAHEGDRDRDGRPVVVAPAPAPVAIERRDEWQARRWREERRERELATARAELRRLEAERAAFYARPHRPGELRRYDRDYLARHAELERRCHELERVAWR
jgi:hypothetical protein